MSVSAVPESDGLRVRQSVIDRTGATEQLVFIGGIGMSYILLFKRVQMLKLQNVEYFSEKFNLDLGCRQRSRDSD